MIINAYREDFRTTYNFLRNRNIFYRFGAQSTLSNLKLFLTILITMKATFIKVYVTENINRVIGFPQNKKKILDFYGYLFMSLALCGALLYSVKSSRW